MENLEMRVSVTKKYRPGCFSRRRECLAENERDEPEQFQIYHRLQVSGTVRRSVQSGLIFTGTSFRERKEKVRVRCISVSDMHFKKVKSEKLKVKSDASRCRLLFALFFYLSPFTFYFSVVYCSLPPVPCSMPGYRIVWLPLWTTQR